MDHLHTILQHYTQQHHLELLTTHWTNKPDTHIIAKPKWWLKLIRLIAPNAKPWQWKWTPKLHRTGTILYNGTPWLNDEDNYLTTHCHLTQEHTTIKAHKLIAYELENDCDCTGCLQHHQKRRHHLSSFYEMLETGTTIDLADPTSIEQLYNWLNKQYKIKQKARTQGGPTSNNA